MNKGRISFPIGGVKVYQGLVHEGGENGAGLEWMDGLEQH